MGFAGVILLGICYLCGKGLVYLGYGKKGYDALKELEGGLPKAPSIVFSILFYIWAFFGVFFYFAFPDSGDADVCLGIMIACPVIYVLWFIYARTGVPALVRQRDKLQSLKAAERNGADGSSLGKLPNRQAQSGDWHCSCGRVNPKYVTTCPCGIRKQDALKEDPLQQA